MSEPNFKVPSAKTKKNTAIDGINTILAQQRTVKVRRSEEEEIRLQILREELRWWKLKNDRMEREITGRRKRG